MLINLNASFHDFFLKKEFICFNFMCFHYYFDFGIDFDFESF